MQEYIHIQDRDGNKKKAKVIIRYHNEENNNFYIVYMYDNEYFAAKYDDVIGTSNLDTNLSEKELVTLNNMLDKILGE